MDGTTSGCGVLGGSWDGNNMSWSSNNVRVSQDWSRNDVRVSKHMWSSDNVGVRVIIPAVVVGERC